MCIQEKKECRLTEQVFQIRYNNWDDDQKITFQLKMMLNWCFLVFLGFVQCICFEFILYPHTYIFTFFYYRSKRRHSYKRIYHHCKNLFKKIPFRDISCNNNFSCEADLSKLSYIYCIYINKKM